MKILIPRGPFKILQEMDSPVKNTQKRRITLTPGFLFVQKWYRKIVVH